MTQERYQRINALADAALELPRSERAEFLHKACEGDRELLQEVNDLLGAHETDAGFMQAPLLDQLAKDLVAGADRHDLTGKQFHHYRIKRQLGAGGLGEVWLAEDTRLGREVALKLLSRMSAADPLQVQRFQREARTASSLNHPNIVTIYEIGLAGEFEFIAQECVNGETLRQRLQRGPMPMETVLDVGAQVAAALAAAHSAGIVHRDIKPENIMLRPDGLVKVLDFGLARFIESATTTSSRSLNLSITRPGIVLGTAKYMSPEQARGHAIDARSDIFSLGAVLYEMAAGTAPFHGQTNSDLIAAILASAPEPMSLRLKAIPPLFEATVNRCLEKDPAHRYQDALAIKKDLDRARHSEPAPMRQTPPSAPGRRIFNLGWRTGLPLAVAILVVAAIGIYYLAKPRRRLPSFNSTRLTRLFVRGRVQDAAISRDGAYVAYFLDEPGGQSLWLRQASSSLQSRLLPPEDGTHTGLAFSANGRYATWLRRTAGGNASTLYRMAITEPGTAVRIRDGLNGAVSFSPDGDWYAYIRLDPARRQSTLMVANIDGTVQRAVETRQGSHYFSRWSLAWSPDGHSIACLVGESNSYSDQAFHLVLVRLPDGREQSLGSRRWPWGGSMSWPVQDRIFLSATQAFNDAFQIWAISTEDGGVTPITNDLTNHSNISAAANGTTVLAIQTQTAVDLWMVEGSNSERAVQITSGDVSGFNGLAWTPDGRIVYSALAGDFRNLWIVNSNGSQLKEITTGPDNKQEPAVTPDGKYILYHAGGAIWRIDIDGKNARRLTFGPNDTHPEPSADGRSVLYGSFRHWTPGLGGTPTLWRVSIDGGEPAPICSLPASVPKLSPDGRFVACEYFPGGDPQLSQDDVAIMSPNGGQPLKVFDRLPAARSFVSWAPDSRAIEWSASAGGFDNVWRQSLAGGAPQEVTHFRGSSIAGYAWSRDGRKLAVARENTTRDMVVIKSGD